MGVYYNKRIKFDNGVKLNIDIWDTTGQETYRSIMSLYYRDAKGVILVYDIGDPQSLHSL